jgi:general secretion pathway protein J
LNTVLVQWQQDLESLVDPATNRATPAALECDGQTLRLVRSDGESLRVVAWSLRNGTWMRWSSPPLTRINELQEQWFRSLQLLGNEAEQVRLIDKVDTWQITFRGQDGTRFNCQSTGDLAPAEAPPAAAPGATPGAPSPAAVQRAVVPRVVELSLTMGGQKLERNLFTAQRG